MAERVKVQTTKFQVSDGGDPEAFNDVPQIKSISGLGSGQSQEIDVTDFDSTGKEFVQGLKDEGSVSIDMVYDPNDTQQTRLETIRSNQETTNFKIVLSDTNNTNFEFAGFITSFEKTLEEDDVMRASVSIRITGAITIT